jgi:hypothetical protein
MVSPWFAAGAGFVIAAGAFIYAPHASLSFGNEVLSPNHTPCAVAACAIPNQAPTMAGGANGLITPSPTPSSASHAPRHAASGQSGSTLDFSYAVAQHGSGMFEMTFSMSSSEPIGNWKLTFDIPGATDLSVSGASWQPSGTDGGTASGPAVGSTPAASQSSAAVAVDSTHAGTEAGGGSQSALVSFVVYGKGEPTVAPHHCSFNGNSCVFSQQH